MPAELPRRIGWRTRLVRWMILLCILALGLAVFLILRAKGAEAGLVLPTAEEEVTAGLAIWLGLQGALFVAVLVWMHAAVANADALAPDPRRIGPWMAVVWWFVPLFNLFQPVRVMSQTWNSSVDKAPDIDGAAAAPVAGWWLLCAVGAAWLPLSLSAMRADPTLEAIYAHAVSVGGALVFWVGGMGCLASCVKTVSRAQRAERADAAPVAQPA